jgi:hypothetical protein
MIKICRDAGDSNSLAKRPAVGSNNELNIVNFRMASSWAERRRLPGKNATE